MQKIGSITSTATSDGLFTNGSVASGVSPTHLEAAWFNTVQTELATVVTAAGLTLDSANDKQLLAALALLSRGVVGHSSNLKMDVPAVSATATLTADEVIVGTAVGGGQYRIANVNKTINLAASGLGGMNTGTSPVNGWVAIYLVYNPTTNDSGLVAINTTSAIAPNCYGAISQLPGYTASALVSVWRTNSSGQFRNGYQRGRKFTTPSTDVINTSVATNGFTALNMSSAIPMNAVAASGYVFCNLGTGTAGVATFRVSSDKSTAGFFQAFAGTGVTLGGDIYYEIMVVTPQTLYYDLTWSTTNASNGILGVTGYTI